MKWARLTYRAVSRSRTRGVVTCSMLLAYVVVGVDALLPGNVLGMTVRLWVSLGFTFFLLFILGAWVREEESKTGDESHQS